MTERKRLKPPLPGRLPETVNPRYKGMAMPDLARLVMRPSDVRAREALRRRQAG